MLCEESPQVTAFETQRHFIRLYLTLIMHAEVYEYKCPVPRTVVKSYYIYVFTTGPKHTFQPLT